MVFQPKMTAAGSDDDEPEGASIGDMTTVDKVAVTSLTMSGRSRQILVPRRQAIVVGSSESSLYSYSTRLVTKCRQN